MKNNSYRHGALAAAFAVLTCTTAQATHAGDHIVVAQEHQHHEHSGGAQPQQNLSEASKEMEAAAQKMHKDMAIAYTNDIDVDFVRGMIPHHQGAIDQALVFIKYTKDLRLRRLALGIIAAQRKEIRFMQKWLKEREQGLAPGEKPASLDDPADPSDALPEPAR